MESKLRQLDVLAAVDFLDKAIVLILQSGHQVVKGFLRQLPLAGLGFQRLAIPDGTIQERDEHLSLRIRQQSTHLRVVVFGRERRNVPSYSSSILSRTERGRIHTFKPPFLDQLAEDVVNASVILRATTDGDYLFQSRHITVLESHNCADNLEFGVAIAFGCLDLLAFALGFRHIERDGVEMIKLEMKFLWCVFCVEEERLL